MYFPGRGQRARVTHLVVRMSIAYPLKHLHGIRG
jgi:hypothetical protein